MNYFDFKKKIEELPFFETKELKLVLGDGFTSSMLVNLRNWVHKGHLIMLRRGLYIIAEEARQADAMSFATKMYQPSYVSMEKALNVYGIIPEAVFTVTSVTTRKTKAFSTQLGNFSYQKIKKEAFGGYETKKNGKISFNMAVPEKALVDFLYLNRNVLNGSQEQFQSYRFNEEFEFNAKKLLDFAKVFRNTKVLFLTQNFIKQYVAK